MNQNTRRIYLQNAFNVRDIGGYRAENGKTVKWNALFRGDGLCALTPEEWTQLEDRGIRTVIDLRSLSETTTHGYKVPDAISYRHCPLQEEDIHIDNPLASAQNAFGRSLTQGYRSMAGEYTQLLAAALEQVAKGLEKGAVLFHCTAGKDRTGVLAAVLLYLLGAEAEDIIADYQVSYTYNRKGVNKMLEQFPQLEQMKPFLYSNAESMEELLVYLEEVNIRKLLADCGFTDEKTAKLKEFALV